MRHTNHRSDDGSSLIIVLAFLIIIGTVTVALLGRTQTNLRVTASSTAINGRLYAAEAGIDHAIQTIRLDTSKCRRNSAGTEVVASNLPLINGRTATVYCKSTNEASLGVNGMGLVLVNNALRSGVTDNIPGGIKMTDRSSSDNASLIAGGAYIEGSMVRDSICSATALCDIEVWGGDLVKYDPNCPAAPNDNLDLTPYNIPYPVISFEGAPVFRARCVGNGPGQRLDLDTIDPGLPDGDPSLPGQNPPPPAAAPTHPAGLPTCTIFSPGTYTSKPTLTQDNFFMPGIYYFSWYIGSPDANGQNASNSLLIGGGGSSRQHIIGGRPVAGETREIAMDQSMNDCAATVAAGISGGVEWVWGSGARLLVDQGAQVELFSRVPGGGSPRPSIYTVPNTAAAIAAGWTPSTHRVDMSSGANSPGWATTANNGDPIPHLPIVDTAPNNNCLASSPPGTCQPQITYHGLIWAPDSQVDFHSRAGVQNFLGGVVARQLFMGPYVNIASSPINGGSGIAVRRMTLVAVVQAQGNEKVLVAQADVNIANNEKRTATITGWNICSLPTGSPDPVNACNS